MSSLTSPLFRESGRIRGCYVYMLLCSDGGPIYVKVGISDNPTSRLAALLTTTPVRPDVFAFCELPSRQLALRMERALHDELAEWRSQGEWFRMGWADRPKFNEGWKAAFKRHAISGWPMRWEKIGVTEIQKLAKRRKAIVQSRWRTWGKPYRDACTAGLRGI